MKTAGAIASLFWILIIPFFPSIAAQQAPNRTPLDQSRPVPEMERLAKAFVGDWNKTETMERGKFFPNGGSRHGVVRVRLAAGGTTLIYEVHSNGSAGKLDGIRVFWWEKGESL